MKKLKPIQAYLIQLLLIIISIICFYFEYVPLGLAIVSIYLGYNFYLLIKYRKREKDTDRLIKDIDEGISENFCSIG
ncbi:MAG TPA: hypothetical protein VIK26_00460, partial [Clostridium sp.]